MSDGRWFEVDSDVETAVRHFRQSVALYREGGFDALGLEGYRATMALMHALQSAHTSFESALLRILDMLGEERPFGDNWHSDLIKRVGASLPGTRPAILGARLARAADETKCWRMTWRRKFGSSRPSLIRLRVGAGPKRDTAAVREPMSQRTAVIENCPGNYHA